MSISPRFFALAVVLSLSASTFAQTKTLPGQNGTDPFSLEQGSTFSASPSAKPNKPSVNATPASTVLTDVQDAMDIIRQNYVGGRKAVSSDLAKSSINSMLKSLDPHSNYYDRAEYSELLGDQRSEYFGTGSTIVSYERSGKLDTFIISTYAGSASQRAGLKFGDRITAVNGKNVTDLSSLEIRDLIRGPKGTTVKVTFERDGTSATYDLRRDRVPQQTVTNAFLMENGIGLIEMPEGFSFTSYEEFDTAFRGLKSKGMSSLILDLRGNPGGILEQSIKIAEKFLPEGSLIVSQRGRLPIDNRIWRSANRKPETLPLVVLVDGESASASEVIAGALQDNDRALIVGQKTFGKGLVQSVLDLPSGGGLTLTTAKYYTPSGRSIQRDYEHNGAYDYYNHKAAANQTDKFSFTKGKRKVFGGDGITPDVSVAPDEITPERIALLDPLFFFAKDLAAKGSAEVTETDVEAFLAFTTEGWNVTYKNLRANAEFIKLRLTYNLTLARSGPTAATEMLLRSDEQVAKAMASMPQAVSFASSYYSTRKPALK